MSQVRTLPSAGPRTPGTGAPAPAPAGAPSAVSRPLRDLAGFGLAGLGVFLALSLASFDPRDDPARAFPVSAEIRNLGGAPGRALAGFLHDWLGALPAYALALAGVLAGVRVAWRPAADPAARRRARASKILPASAPAMPNTSLTGNGPSPDDDDPAPRPSGGLRVALAAPRAAPAAARAARPEDQPLAVLAVVRPLGAVAALLALSTIEHLLHRGGLLSGELFAGRNPGGFWGTFLAGALLRNFDPAIGYAIATLGGLVGLVLALDVTFRRAPLPATTARAPQAPPPAPVPAPVPAPAAAPAPAPAPVPEPEPEPEPAPLIIRTVPVRPAADPPALDADLDDDPVPTPSPAPAPEPTPAPAPVAASIDADDDEPPVIAPAPAPAAVVVATAAPPPPAPAPAASRERQLLLIPDFHPLPDAAPGRDALDVSYPVPPNTMLTPAEAGPIDEQETIMREKAQILERTLANFKVDARVIAVERGPNITQYEIELAAGVKVHRIMSLGDDIALAMKAASIRIISPIPGRSTVGVEVPNQDQDTVRLRELLESDEYGGKDFAIPLFLGKDSTGNPLVADLARMPHLLIAGATGSGKSVCMNTVITSILMTRKPSEVKLILIDPKMVELSLYEGIPHLMAPVVTDMRKSPSVLEWAVNKMEERYALLSRVAVRHIKSYNALAPAEIAARLGLEGEDALVREKVPHHMPYIVVVIDEFADLMCVARKEVEGSIIRLAQKSRAVGIHLILATQRPTADVITGLIKSNMPCRIAFQVASKVDSRTIIDKNGAENLVGQGDMLYLPPGTANVIRAQGTYISEDEVKAIVKFTKSAAKPEFHPELVKWEAGEGSGEGGGPEDDLFDQAVRIILESQRGSASLLQRRLEIGYSRASRLIDIMTERGILGPFKGSKAREILLSVEDWDAMKARERGEAA